MQTSQVRTAKIDDFGAHIAGARKERGGGTATQAGPGARTGLPLCKSRPLTDFWPSPDWREVLEERGKEVTACLRAMRDQLRSSRDLDDDEYRRRTGRGALSTIAGAVDRGEMDPEAAYAAIRTGGDGRWLHTRITERARAYEAYGHGADLRQYGVGRTGDRYEVRFYRTTTAGTFVARHGEPVRTWAEVPEQIAKILGRKKKSRNPYAAGSWLVDGGKRYGVMRKLGGRWEVFHRCETLADARSLAADPERRDRLDEAWEAHTTIPHERPAGKPGRRTPEVLTGKISPEAFHTEVKLRGVQFGNYVRAAEREQDLADALLACRDLAEAIGWEIGELSLGSTLGLAFGARGKGGRRRVKAHYETGQQVINVTKGDGAGSFGHEWFHALDHAVMRFRTGAPTPGEAGDLMSRTYRGVHGPGAIAGEAVLNLVSRTRYMEFGERAQRLDGRRGGKDYWGTGPEMCARAFEAWIRHVLKEKGIENPWLVTFESRKGWRKESEGDTTGLIADSWPYPDEREVKLLDDDFRTLLREARSLIAGTAPAADGRLPAA